MQPAPPRPPASFFQQALPRPSQELWSCATSPSFDLYINLPDSAFVALSPDHVHSRNRSARVSFLLLAVLYLQRYLNLSFLRAFFFGCFGLDWIAVRGLFVDIWWDFCDATNLFAFLRCFCWFSFFILNAMIFLKVFSEAHWFRRSEIAIAVGF
jgi:hypothetical protein